MIAKARQPLTSRQAEVLREIGSSRIPPTIRELAVKLGVSIGTIQDHLARLKELGEVTWRPGAARTLQVVDQGVT
jgi:DNA-binding MarR family transcriptional regulator